MNNPRYSINKCKIGQHLFNSEKGFILIRVYNPTINSNADWTDTFICLKCASDKEMLPSYTVKF